MHIKQHIESYFDRLWPINRSITGPGIRESMDILGEIIPTTRLTFKTDQKVFDWIVPREWSVSDAYFIDPDGKKHAEFSKNNLHLMGYSVPVKNSMPLKELQHHLYSLPDLPDAVPYVTSYYHENWGFCISQKERDSLQDGTYQVCIDSKLYPGAVEIGEAVLPGKTDDEILFSTYLCHPSMANNELSGPLVMAFLYDKIKKIPGRRYTYRFLLSAETIGTICYLSKRGQHLKDHLVAGYVMSCLGDSVAFAYKCSRQGNTLSDRVAATVLRDKCEHKIYPFDPGAKWGSDERQYCSPGFNLPVGSLTRAKPGYFREYHTSFDNKDFINFDSLVDSVDVFYSIVKALEANRVWENTIKYCEPQLGRRGLYPSVNCDKTWEDKYSSMLWLLNLTDGMHDLLTIADDTGQNLELLIDVAQELSDAGLLK